jgi:cysteine desulfurase
LKRLRDLFEEKLLTRIPDLKINGSLHSRLPNNSNISFPGVDAEALLLNIPEIVASTGSACESGSIEPSRVLMAIGIPSEIAYQTIRFGFSRFNTEDEINAAVELIIRTYFNLRN